MDSPWNSLEVVKLIVNLIFPLMMVYLGFFVAKLTRGIEKREWSNKKIIEKRMNLYEDVVPKLNDLFCYYIYVGNWKDFNPEDIVDKKRYLDKQFHIYSNIFNEDILEAYEDFIHNCFKTFNEFGSDAKLKTSLKKRKEVEKGKWNDAWDVLFDEEDQIVEKETFIKSYNRLLSIFRSELGVERESK